MIVREPLRFVVADGKKFEKFLRGDQRYPEP